MGRLDENEYEVQIKETMQKITDCVAKENYRKGQKETYDKILRIAWDFRYLGFDEFYTQIASMARKAGEEYAEQF